MAKQKLVALLIVLYFVAVLSGTALPDTADVFNSPKPEYNITEARTTSVVIEPTTISPSQNSRKDSPSVPPSSLAGRSEAVDDGPTSVFTEPEAHATATEGQPDSSSQNKGSNSGSTLQITSLDKSPEYFASILEAIKLTASTAVSIFFIFGSLIQYYGQFWEIRKGKGEAFSPLVCLVLLSSNIIRIFYWFGQRFDDLYLYQSAVMIFVQIMMLEAISKAREKRPSSSPKKRFVDLKISDFWAWDDWASYLQCIALFCAILFVACFLALPYPSFYSMLGGTGLMIEATLALPQLYRNYAHGSEGLDPFLIWTWAIGDVAKTALAVSLQTPPAFVLSGMFQIITDVLILIQIYSDRKQKEKQKQARGTEMSVLRQQNEQ